MPRKPIVRGNLPSYAINIRRILRDREMTHAQFADKVKLSKQSMYSALNGGDIRVSTLFRMARELKVEPHTLLLPEAPARTVEVASPMPQGNLLAALLAGMNQPVQSTMPVPQAAADFLSAWSHLDARDIHALMSLARTLSANKAEDASYRHAVNQE